MNLLGVLLAVSLLLGTVLAQGYGTCTSSSSQTLTTATGELGCNSYGNYITKTWLIQIADNTQRIILTFDAFDTEANYDFLKVYDGPSSSATLLGSYSGTTIPGPFRSSANSLYISFRSDQYVTGDGFHATWQQFSVAAGVVPCTTSFATPVQLTGSTGTFGCDGYGSNILAAWHITANAGERIILNFLVFGTEHNYDWVSVYDGGSTSAEQIAHYSGNDLPPPVTASGNELYVTLTSDYSLSSLGFTAQWSSIATVVDPCYNTTQRIKVDPEGYFGCPYGYGNNVQSSWLIHPPGNLVVQLDFLSLDLQTNYDFISVYDGMNASAALIGTFSGVTTPGRIVSSNNSLFLQFHSDASVTQGGFAATYRSYEQLISGGCSRSGIYNFTTPSETFGCEGYGSGVVIRWYLNAQPHEVIRVTFDSFGTQADHDVLTIYDGNSTTATAFSYSGNTVPPPFVSTSSLVMIVFVSDNDGVTGDGFSGLYESITVTGATPCSTSHSSTLTAQEAEFGCNGYSNSVVDTWLIHVQEHYVILLVFDAFYTEGGADILTVYDGPNDQSTVLGTYSGIQNPPALTSNSNYLYVKFTSDSKTTRLGFIARYSSVFTGEDAGSCVSSASHTLSDESGSFGCAGYGSNVVVTWLIEGATGSRVELEFTSFQTEYNFDFVKVYDGSSSSAPLIGSFSGFTTPDSVQSTSNTLYVKFTSDASLSYDGFTANYQVVVPTSSKCSTSTSQTLTGSSGEFGCAGYDNNVDSSWSISVAAGQRISLSFLVLETELYYDYIKVYDGSNTHGNLLGTYSGTTIPSPLSSTSNVLYVTFHSDSSVSSGFAGFNIAYEAYGSYGNNTCTVSTTQPIAINQGTGEFGCSGYGNNVDISWLITSYGNIHLYFSRFDTEANYDFVSIYDGSSASATRLARYSGTHTGTVNSSGPTLFIEFISDANVVRSGFTGVFSTVVINEAVEVTEQPPQ